MGLVLPEGVSLSIIVAAADNWAIGRENTLPWSLPKDLAFFKKSTLGKPILMGRKTYDSIGRPLPGRQNIVVTRQKSWSADGVDVANDLQTAIDMAVFKNSERELMIIGGANLYNQALPSCNRLYLTRVAMTVDGDAFFPPVDFSQWRVTFNEIHAPDDRHACEFSFQILERETIVNKKI